MLAGTRILDLTWVLGGPFGTQLLAQLGAEVIKLEPPAGDLARKIPPHFHEGESSFFLSANRGKSSVVIDIKQADGYAVLLDLVREVDAVVYGFSPEVPKRLGLDHETLARTNPTICVGEIIGIHDGPPFSRTPAFDLVVQALGGIMSITGETDGRPQRVGYQIADLAGGLYLALGTLAAIHRAKATGKGGRVQISLLDCQLALLTWQAQNYFISGEVPVALGARHAMIAPSDAFRAADGENFVVSPTGEAFWLKFCEAIGRAELAEDPLFAT
ncbi:MAG: CoA transferase, partial [Kiloniellales bacterium]|nr:CoA transferase [Kiloniellales bacterium]